MWLPWLRSWIFILFELTLNSYRWADATILNNTVLDNWEFDFFFLEALTPMFTEAVVLNFIPTNNSWGISLLPVEYACCVNYWSHSNLSFASPCHHCRTRIVLHKSVYPWISIPASEEIQCPQEGMQIEASSSPKVMILFQSYSCNQVLYLRYSGSFIVAIVASLVTMIELIIIYRFHICEFT